MYRRLLIALIFSFSLPDLVAAGDIYTVDKILVDERAGSASAARRTAITNGQRRALEIVLRRLTNVTDISRLPAVSTIPPAGIVASFSVRDEKTSNQRYLASLKVTFKPEAIRTILRVRNIPISEVQAPPHLLLPVLETPTGPMLWGDHWWYQFWRSFDISNIPTPLILPLGDTDDSLTLSVEALDGGDEAKLWALARRYQADAILVVRARLDVPQDLLADTVLDLSSTLYGTLGGEVIVRRYVGDTTGERLAQYGTGELLTLLSDRWKQLTAVETAREADIVARAEYGDFAAWRQLLSGMEETTLIRNLNLEIISSRWAILRLSFVGTPDQLAADLYRVGVLLVRSADDRWVLSNRTFVK